ncbi:MAG TPA: DUF2357 domain-containing protein [Bacteroidia bacterium]|nr:DUF2357 domain-containing protein [Bacteroidia bacterium]HRH07880.1 DUF2357 domain-containing protein [Bacteroidia bacterium]
MMQIPLSHIEEGLELEIKGDSENTLIVISEEEAFENGEARFQLKEGCNYEFQFNKPEFKFKLSYKNKIVSDSKFDKHKGSINPNIFVGTHTLEVADTNENLKGFINIEVQSVKSEYREDYRYMLESITEKCTDLIMQIDSPVNQQFETNFEVDSLTLYQRFSFVKALIDSREFEESIQKIVSNPTTKWRTESEEKDIRNIKRFAQKSIKQIVSNSNRVSLPISHFLRKNHKIESIPVRIESERKTESVDTSENRFIKHALEEFLFFCENCHEKFEKYSRAKLEANVLSGKISNLLNQSFFKEISRPNSLSLNSPVLQRKSGYREVLNAWLKFDLAAKLIWYGGDDVYKAGKKDIATLYEYWLFFTLLDIFKDKSVFNIEPKSIQELIQFDKGKLSVNLKQGKTIALKGVFNSATRKLNIQFCYNRSFGGGRKYPNGGSFTTTLRPDYTLSIWPAEILKAEDAEEKELITHIHFDAKYKVNNFYQLVKTSKEENLTIDEEKELLEEETEEKKGTFKNADLLKMHAYKDAIRRTGGAYVLYPGEGKDKPFRGFHELIPGLGAFVLKPNKDQTGREELKKFILHVVDNFIDRASQRENTASKVYEIHKHKKDDNDILREPMPEYFDTDNQEKIIPDETFVLVGYCKNPLNIDWYKKEGKYNFRMDDDKGSLTLENNVVNAKYLLLRESGKDSASRIFKIKSKGPKVYKGTSLVGYKTSDLKDYYLVIEIEKEESKDLNTASFNFKELEKYKEIKANNNPVTAPGIPFAISLTELMKVKIK